MRFLLSAIVALLAFVIVVDVSQLQDHLGKYLDERVTTARKTVHSPCASVPDDAKRLACYDKNFGKPKQTKPVAPGKPKQTKPVAPGKPKQTKPVAPNTGKWKIRIQTSDVDDSTNVYLSLKSKDTFTLRYRDPERVTFWIQCRENRTFAFFDFDGAFMAGYDDKDIVTMRIDKQKAFKASLSISTSNESMGFFSGARSIPFIKRLFGGENLLLRFTPYSESTYTVNFPITGLREAIKPLAEVCHWRP